MNSIKRGSSYPHLTFAFTDTNNNPVDCSIYDIELVVKNELNEVVINCIIGAENSPAIWDDENAGQGHYDWQSGDTEVIGVFKYEFKFLRKADDHRFTVPPRGFYVYRVIENIVIPTT